MSLIRWNPVPELNTSQRQMNRLFDNFFSLTPWEHIDQPLKAWSPLVDIREDDDAYFVHAELPGIKKEDVKITMNNNTLTLRGEKKHEFEKKDSNYHHFERSYGNFERTFTLPSTVKIDKIDATYTDGILTIVLPKTEDAKPREIQVKVK